MGKTASKGAEGIKVIARNKKARFNYAIEERFEAGICLVGSEVKSIRAGRVSITEAYARFSDHGELHLVDAHIAEYPWANQFNHEPRRARKLLMHKRELARLSDKVNISGYTLVPMGVYLKQGLVKLELGLGKGKKVHDKRQDLKKRDAKREIERALS